MKPVNRLFIAILFALLAFRANSQLIVNDTLTFSWNDVAFDTIGSYVRPVLAGCHYTDVVGAPNMPYLVKDYLLPHNAEITGISILDSNHFTLQGTYLIYPTQTPIILDGRPAPPFVEPDPAYYNSGSRYVGDVAEIQTESSSYGYGFVRVKVFPLQYIPLTQQLVLFTFHYPMQWCQTEHIQRPLLRYPGFRNRITSANHFRNEFRFLFQSKQYLYRWNG